MSDHDATPLPPELDALLATEREAPELPDRSKARVRARIEQTAGLVPPIGGGGGDGGNGPSGHNPSGGGTAAGGAGAAALAAGKLAGRLPFGTTMFVIGALAGVGGHAGFQRLSRAGNTAPYRESPPPPPRAPAPVEPPAALDAGLLADAAALDAASLAVPVVGPADAAVRAPTPRLVRPLHLRHDGGALAGRDEELAEQTRLIERAGAALQRHRFDAGLEAIEQLARRFPDGQMAEERESLRVQLLVAAGRDDEARSWGARFSRRFPRSIMQPVVDAALRSIP